MLVLALYLLHIDYLMHNVKSVIPLNFLQLLESPSKFVVQPHTN